MADPNRWEGLGIPSEQIQPGMAVMVAYTAGAMVNGDPALICWAKVIGKADSTATGVFREEYRDQIWWLQVYTAPGLSLPQMFHADQILGVPALGLSMPEAAETVELA